MQSLQNPSPAIGSLTSGPSASLVDRTIEFVTAELVAWRDDAERQRESSEEALNAQLCKYLNVASRLRFPMVHFSHEERQVQQRRVDIAANPTSRLLIGSTFHSIYQPFVVFEGKRLPAPSKDREREYVSGGVKRSGGIQRFKLGLHGAGLPTSVLIGYVQSGTLRAWFTTINQWIGDECSSPSNPGENWQATELLTGFIGHQNLLQASASSHHTRSDENQTPFVLQHLWLVV